MIHEFAILRNLRWPEKLYNDHLHNFSGHLKSLSSYNITYHIDSLWDGESEKRAEFEFFF